MAQRLVKVGPMSPDIGPTLTKRRLMFLVVLVVKSGVKSEYLWGAGDQVHQFISDYQMVPVTARWGQAGYGNKAQDSVLTTSSQTVTKFSIL